jgi:hypothetical protein
MDPVEYWRQIFHKWPKEMTRRGIIVTKVNETVPFKGFMTTEDMVVLDRTNPDPLGSRFVMIGYGAIEILKFIDALKEDAFAKLGFAGKFT